MGFRMVFTFYISIPSLFSKNMNCDIITFCIKNCFLNFQLILLLLLFFPLKKQYLYTFEYFIQIKTSGKTQFKLFHHHFCLNIRFFMYFRLGASLLPVKMAAI